MTQTRRRFPESFKREAVDQVLAGTPLRHVAETLGDAFPGNGKQRGESAGFVGYASNWPKSPWNAMF